MSDHPSITDLVTSAAHGDEQAWDALVERRARAARDGLLPAGGGRVRRCLPCSYVGADFASEPFGFGSRFRSPYSRAERVT